MASAEDNCQLTNDQSDASLSTVDEDAVHKPDAEARCMSIYIKHLFAKNVCICHYYQNLSSIVICHNVSNFEHTMAAVITLSFKCFVLF